MSTRPGNSGQDGAGTAAAALDLASLDVTQPQAFYLPSTYMEPLSDCFAMVEGVRLPLHSQILSAQSTVLRDLFLMQHEGGGSALAAKESCPDLSAAFGGDSLEAASCFLRLVYRGHEISPASFAALSTAGHLASMAKLAHKLDADVVVHEVVKYILDLASRLPAEEGSMQQLLEALRAADACQSSNGQSRCLEALADVLTVMGPEWPEGQLQAVAAFGSYTLATLLQIQEKRAARGCCYAPPILEARPRSSHTVAGGFTWAVEGFSKLQKSAGIFSPWVDVGGFKCLEANPKGKSTGKDTHLSVYPHLDIAQAQAAGVPSVTTRYMFSALDQRVPLGEGPFADHTFRNPVENNFTMAAPGWVMAGFMPLEELHSTDHGFLLHDRLLLRVNIRITSVERVAG